MHIPEDRARLVLEKRQDLPQDPPTIPFADCLKCEFGQEELLPGYRCDKCTKSGEAPKGGTKVVRMQNMGRVLIVQLKRFTKLYERLDMTVTVPFKNFRIWKHIPTGSAVEQHGGHEEPLQHRYS